MLSIEWALNKISGIKLVFSLLNYQDDAPSHKHKSSYCLSVEHFTTNAQNILHGNQCKHGNIGLSVFQNSPGCWRRSHRHKQIRRWVSVHFTFESQTLKCLSFLTGRGEISINFWLRLENSLFADVRSYEFFPSLYAGCNRRNGPDFGRVFLMLYYTDITQNTYVQSRTITEIIAREKCGLHRSRRTVRRPWRHTCPMRLPDNETL